MIYLNAYLPSCPENGMQPRTFGLEMPNNHSYGVLKLYFVHIVFGRKFKFTDEPTIHS